MEGVLESGVEEGEGGGGGDCDGVDGALYTGECRRMERGRRRRRFEREESEEGFLLLPGTPSQAGVLPSPFDLIALRRLDV